MNDSGSGEGGVTVEYKRLENTGTAAQSEADDKEHVEAPALGV